MLDVALIKSQVIQVRAVAVLLSSQGIMAGLDRRYFTVTLFCIVNANMYLDPNVLATGDEVYHVPLSQQEGNRVSHDSELPGNHLVREA